MSARSAKLLLEISRAIEQKSDRQPSTKLAGTYDVPLHVGLVNEITTWARGYREHLKKKGAKA